jgi:hypothetical protein
MIWDAPIAASIEIRTSVDGATWSEWVAPGVSFSEEDAHTGHIDLDAPAGFFQYRVPDPAAPPSFVHFQPMEEIPPAVPEQSVSEIAESTEALTADSIPIHTRAEWGARAPRCIESMTPWRATVHHTAGPTNDTMLVKKRLRQIQAYHMFTENMCDIAYNYLVSRDGRVWQGRGKNREGGHTFGENSGNVGVSFIGNYSTIQINHDQKCNAAKLFAWLHQKHNAIKLTREDVKGHRQYGAEFGATACPGDKLYNQIDEILQAARNGGC